VGDSVTDTHRRFLFDDMPVRGGWVHIDAAYREVLARHDYPPVLRRLLGELLAATALLANNLKFKGSLIVQVQSPGPLRLLVVECTDEFGLRAIAKWQGDLPDDADLLQLAGNGRCVITMDPRNGARMYQGIVAMEKGTVAEVLEHHMQSSEQLATRMWLAADGEYAAGLLLQKLPSSGDRSIKGGEDWDRVTLLGSTVRRGELLTLAGDALLQQLFAEETVRLFAEHAVRFECGCSEARVANALLLLGRGEIEQVLTEQGRIEAACEFCNRKYAFDRARALALFALPEPGPTVH
jgi:molecular chaperone Hsp33